MPHLQQSTLQHRENYFEQTTNFEKHLFVKTWVHLRSRSFNTVSRYCTIWNLFLYTSKLNLVSMKRFRASLKCQSLKEIAVAMGYIHVYLIGCSMAHLRRFDWLQLRQLYMCYFGYLLGYYLLLQSVLQLHATQE